MKLRQYRSLAPLLTLTLIFGCRGDQPELQDTPEPASQEIAAEKPEPQTLAAAAKDALFMRLSQRLLMAMGDGGPASAVEVCGEAAPEIAAKVGSEFGVKIGRTSFKLRNPENAPPDWAREFVEKKTGERQLVDLPDGATGVMFPIALTPQCLVCHGTAEQIDGEVLTQLEEHYPEDQATGFKTGDLRGWFWVEVPEAKNDLAPRTKDQE